MRNGLLGYWGANRQEKAIRDCCIAITPVSLRSYHTWRLNRYNMARGIFQNPHSKLGMKHKRGLIPEQVSWKVRFTKLNGAWSPIASESLLEDVNEVIWIIDTEPITKITSWCSTASIVLKACLSHGRGERQVKATSRTDCSIIPDVIVEADVKEKVSRMTSYGVLIWSTTTGWRRWLPSTNAWQRKWTSCYVIEPTLDG